MRPDGPQGRSDVETSALVAEAEAIPGTVMTDSDRMVELLVRIHDKEGRVEWPVPRAILVNGRRTR